MKIIAAFLQKHLDDMLLIAGCAAIIYGVSLIFVPAAWIAAGVLCLGLAFLIGLGGKQS